MPDTPTFTETDVFLAPGEVRDILEDWARRHHPGQRLARVEAWGALPSVRLRMCSGPSDDTGAAPAPDGGMLPAPGVEAIRARIDISCNDLMQRLGQTVPHIVEMADLPGPLAALAVEAAVEAARGADDPGLATDLVENLMHARTLSDAIWAHERGRRPVFARRDALRLAALALRILATFPPQQETRP